MHCTGWSGSSRRRLGGGGALLLVSGGESDLGWAGIGVAVHGVNVVATVATADRSIHDMSSNMHGGKSGGNEKVSYKKRIPKQSGSDGAKNVPEWARGEPPTTKETPHQYAKRLMDEQYGEGGWDPKQTNTPKSEYSRIKKGHRGYE